MKLKNPQYNISCIAVNILKLYKLFHIIIVSPRIEFHNAAPSLLKLPFPYFVRSGMSGSFIALVLSINLNVLFVIRRNETTLK